MRSVKQCGFTLIEILVVLFIISIVTSVALMSLTRNSSREIESLSRELSELITLAEEQAILTSSVLGLRLDPTAFYFKRYQKHDKTFAWQTLSDSVLGIHSIPNGIEIKMSAQNKLDKEDEPKDLPQIVISTNGDITPFMLTIGRNGEKPRYRITGNADGQVSRDDLF